METKVYTIPELKSMLVESIINKTNGKISKISDNSVLNGVAFGISKIFQKGLKDSALVESELFPEYAYGEYLDKIALRNGVAPRLTNQKSTVYLRLVAQPGSVYNKINCVFISSTGVSFKLFDSFTVPAVGFGYVLVQSVEFGSEANVPAFSINRVVGGPSGHLYVLNEVTAWGGIDYESDESFKSRILQNFNNFAFDTLSKIRSVLSTLDQRVLDVRKSGVDSFGRTKLDIVTVNGATLSTVELETLLDKSKYYLSLSEQGITSGLSSTPNIVLGNVSYQMIGIDCRIGLKSGVNYSDFARKVQVQITKYLDFRTWDREFVDWEELYYIIRNQQEVDSVPDQFFSPSEDIKIQSNSLPRLQGFVIRDLKGNILIDSDSNVIPVYYSEQYDMNILTQINYNYGG